MAEFPCPSCGARCFPNETTCPSCGVNINEAVVETERYTPRSKYPVLRAIATGYQIFAVAIGVVTAIAFFVTLGQSALITMLWSGRCDFILGDSRRDKSLR